MSAGKRCIVTTDGPAGAGMDQGTGIIPVPFATLAGAG